ncbi:hypothetical protein SY88_19540 [Clostridiales bacterium PH28_bin88]|nr:hypothetical protein SY88_19540 [Clostridiales bacterium PH28_bin88]
MAGTGLTLVDGIPGLLLYLAGVAVLAWASGFTIVSTAQLVWLLGIGTAVMLLTAVADRLLTRRWPVPHQVASILVGFTMGGLLLGMFFGPTKGLAAAGAGTGLPLFMLYRRYGPGRLLAGSLGLLLRVTGVVALSGLLAWWVLGG